MSPLLIAPSDLSPGVGAFLCVSPPVAACRDAMLLEGKKIIHASGQIPCKPTPENDPSKPKASLPPNRVRERGTVQAWYDTFSQDMIRLLSSSLAVAAHHKHHKSFLLLSLPTHGRRPWFSSIRSWNSLLHCRSSFFYFFNCSARRPAALSCFTLPLSPLPAFQLSNVAV